MCKVCGNAEHHLPGTDGIPEYTAETLRRVAHLSGPDQATPASVRSGIGLLALFNRNDMPVAEVGLTDDCGHVGLGFEWRSHNRVLEIEVFSNGQSYEFLVASIESEDGEDVNLAYRMGSFTYEHIKSLPEGDRGPAVLADWLLGGEFPESLDRYLYLEDQEAQCSDSETGSEPPNTTD